MFKLLCKTLPLLLIVTTQAQAGFLFCESKIKKVGITPENAKLLCDLPSIDPIKEMLNTEVPSDVRDALNLMYNSSDLDYKTKSKKITIFIKPNIKSEDALIIAKAIPEDAVKSFSAIIKRYPHEAVSFSKKIPAEKIKFASELSTKYPEDSKSFLKLIESKSVEKLALISQLNEKAGINDALFITSRYNDTDIQCALSFTNADSAQLKKNVDNCYNFSNNKICGAKKIIFSSLAKQPDNLAAGEYLENINRSDFFTKNQATLFSKIYDAGYGESMKSELLDVLKYEIVSEELINKVSLELEKPSADKESLTKILRQYAKVTRRVSAPKTIFKGSESANWGNGSFPACSSSDGKVAIRNSKNILEQNCHKKYSEEILLECDTEIEHGNGKLICYYAITVSPSYWPKNTLTCDDLDTIEGLVSLQVLNKDKKDTGLYINDQFTKEKLISIGVSPEVFTPKTMAK